MAKVLNTILIVFGVIFIVVIILAIIMYYKMAKDVKDMKKGISSLIYNTVKIDPGMTEDQKKAMADKISTCMVDNMVCAFGLMRAKKLYDRKVSPTEMEVNRLQTIAVSCGLPTIGGMF